MSESESPPRSPQKSLCRTGKLKTHFNGFQDTEDAGPQGICQGLLQKWNPSNYFTRPTQMQCLMFLCQAFALLRYDCFTPLVLPFQKNVCLVYYILEVCILILIFQELTVRDFGLLKVLECLKTIRTFTVELHFILQGKQTLEASNVMLRVKGMFTHVEL